MMKEYLLETFSYNDSTNKKLLEKIKQLPDKSECIELFSHLINSQYKWMARIKQDPAAKTMSWWDPIYELESLEEQWNRSLKIWLDYIDEITEDDLSKEVSFVGFDGALWAATPKDIALQLNYHSIHHRAQIQTIIRKQGLEPDFVDYIGTKYRRIGRPTTSRS
ncbi:MAG: DinB family protein [Flavisolibacter sp.]